MVIFGMMVLSGGRAAFDHLHLGFNRAAEPADFRKILIRIFCSNTELLRSKCNGCVFNAFQSCNLIFHFSGAMGAAQIFHQIYGGIAL